jgi:hypothetical protein
VATTHFILGEQARFGRAWLPRPEKKRPPTPLSRVTLASQATIIKAAVPQYTTITAAYRGHVKCGNGSPWAHSEEAQDLRKCGPEESPTKAMDFCHPKEKTINVRRVRNSRRKIARLCTLFKWLSHLCLSSIVDKTRSVRDAVGRLESWTHRVLGGQYP